MKISLMNRIGILQKIIDHRIRCRYLEIGVRYGDCFFQLRNATRKIAVDPYFAFSKKSYVLNCLKNPSNFFRSEYFSLTSDQFFSQEDYMLKKQLLDVVFIDGLHTHQQSYTDAMNALKYLKDDGIIVLHDCNPASQIAAEPAVSAEEIRQKYQKATDWNGFWNGDVWKTIVKLRTRSDLQVHVLDCDFGLGIIAKRPTQNPLNYSDQEISQMKYTDLKEKRVELLNLIDPSGMDDILSGKI